MRTFCILPLAACGAVTRVAGVATLVAHGGGIVEFQAQGMADIEAGRAMQKDSIFQIMSTTKPVRLAFGGRPILAAAAF